MNKEELHQMLHPMKLIGLGGNKALNEKIANILHMPLLETSVHHFSDGEIAVNIAETVRGCDVFVIQSIQDPVNENFMELEIVCEHYIVHQPTGLIVWYHIWLILVLILRVVLVNQLQLS